MTPGGPRFERQTCLREVGLAGQARIEAGALELGPHLDELGLAVARRYASGAGLVRETSGSVAPPEALSLFRHSSSRSVAAGALTALSAITKALSA
jgi:hypothetical protein